MTPRAKKYIDHVVYCEQIAARAPAADAAAILRDVAILWRRLAAWAEGAPSSRSNHSNDPHGEEEPTGQGILSTRRVILDKLRR